MNNTKKAVVFDYIGVVVLLIVDLVIKKVITPLNVNGALSLIDGVLEFRYLENRGAAFGILQGQRVFFVFIAIVVFAVMSYLFIKIPAEKKYIKLNVCLVLILAGALGNTFDRLYYGYVRDFIYFKLINFPIFNVADIYITCSTIWLVLMIMFSYKEEDLAFVFASDKVRKKDK